jgi:hypothetical protein
MVVIRRGAFFAIAATVVASCSDQATGITERTAALRYDVQLLVSPAYNTNGTSFGAYEANGANPYGSSYVIINAGCDYTGRRGANGLCLVGGGPGPTSPNSFLLGQIPQLHAAGISVFGYVWDGTLPGPPMSYREDGDVENDIWYWAQYGAGQSSNYKLDGIFFDGAWRNTKGGVAEAERLTDVVQSTFTFDAWRGLGDAGRAIFNWGSTPNDNGTTDYDNNPMKLFVDCVILRNYWQDPSGDWQTHFNHFVTNENYAGTFLGTVQANPPLWMQNRYNPIHFITIIHDAASDGSNVAQVLTKARTWNSMFTYVTEEQQSSTNPYAGVPTSAVWSTELNILNNSSSGQYQYGVAPDDSSILSAPCPGADPTTPGYPGNVVSGVYVNQHFNYQGFDWDPWYYKGDCSPGWALTGLSDSTSSSQWGHALLCREASPLTFYSGSYVRTLAAPGDQRAYVRSVGLSTDWAPNYWKLECGQNEYVAGVSSQLGASTTFHAIKCASTQGLNSNYCMTQTFDSYDDDGAPDDDDWDWGYFKGECRPNWYVAGVSVSASYRPHSLLCCPSSL